MFRRLKGSFVQLKYLWCLDANNLFRNSFDAFGGSVVLIVFPVIAIAMLVYQTTTGQKPTFISYSYPLITICISAGYDIWGRWQKGHFRNVKLGVRLVLDTVAFLISLALSMATEIFALHFLPLGAIFISGVLLLRDMFARWSVSIAVMNQKWGGGNIAIQLQKNKSNTSC